MYYYSSNNSSSNTIRAPSMWWWWMTTSSSRFTVVCIGLHQSTVFPLFAFFYMPRERVGRVLAAHVVCVCGIEKERPVAALLACQPPLQHLTEDAARMDELLRKYAPEVRFHPVSIPPVLIGLVRMRVGAFARLWLFD